MSLRSTRRAPSNPSLSSIEALLLAQATWEYGAASTNWPQISKILSRHPLLSRPKSFFTPQSCHTMYEHLLKEAGLELSEANYVPHADTNLSLAQKYYRARFEELKELIVTEECNFKSILKEIEEIRAGLLDTKSQSRPEKPASVTDSKNVPVLQKTHRGTNRPQEEPGLVSARYASSSPIEDENSLAEGKNQRPTRAGSTFRRTTSQIPDREHANLEDLPTSRQDAEHTDQRQEEEEEELEAEEENKEEEEETSQGHGELELDQNVDASASPKSGVFSMKTESGLLLDVFTGEKHTSDVEEPMVQARRSSRRRKSSTVSTISYPQVKTRLRARGRAADEGLESDIDDSRDNISAVDDETTSSPFDPGTTTRRREGKRKASIVDSVDSPQDKKRTREDSEPVEEEEPGPSVHNTRARAARNTTKTEEQVASKRFQNVIGLLHSQISQHRNGTIFHNPIKPSEAPDYHDIVKRPMDLKTIKNKVRDGMTNNSLEFQRDIYLMFANAMMYNRPGSDVYTMAEEMMLESEAQINTFRQTEGLSVKKGHR